MFATKKDAFGCKVTHQIIHPEYVIVFDELGGNTSQKGDGNVGGQLMLCERGKTPQLKISTRDKHYTMMGLTSINGKPVMCVVIFAGKCPNVLCETGLDLHAPTVGEPSDPEFFEQNSVPGKRFPCGPTCEYLGNQVPCFCAWTEKGGVTSEVLVKMLATLDEYEVFDREHGIVPFLIADGHGSRFELDFLEYICEPKHEWALCIGVPYGTALWHVGDSPEQNGAMNMASVEKKRNIVHDNEKHMRSSPYIAPHEIMNVVIAGCKKFFGCYDHCFVLLTLLFVLLSVYTFFCFNVLLPCLKDCFPDTYVSCFEQITCCKFFH